MPLLQDFSGKRWAEVEEELGREIQNAFTESAHSNSDIQTGVEHNDIALRGNITAGNDAFSFPEVYEQGPFMLLQHDFAQQLQVAPAIPRTLYPRQSDGVAGLEVPPELGKFQF